MNTAEIITTILGAGGFAGIVLKIFLETGIKESIGSAYKRQLEDHKFLLKNSEKVFQFKLDASKSIYRIFHNVKPSRNHPDMDWYEAGEVIATGFGRHEKALTEFLCEYQSTLTPGILERIETAIAACSDGSFEFYWDGSQEDRVCTDAAREKADELYKALEEAVEMLRKEVREMISAPNA